MMTMLSVNKYANESALSLVLGSQHNATRTCCGAPASQSSCYRWISAAGAASSNSQPHVHAVCRRSTGQTDRQTDRQRTDTCPLYTPYTPHTVGSASTTMWSKMFFTLNDHRHQNHLICLKNIKLAARA